MLSNTIVLIVGIILAIAATVFLFIKVLPSKKDGTFSNKLLQRTHDYFNFKKLYIESILKAVFAFATVATVLIGVLTLTLGSLIDFISLVSSAVQYNVEIGEFMQVYWPFLWRNLLTGLFYAVVAPLALRLGYELIMMFVLLVKNVIEINNKMKKKDE